MHSQLEKTFKTAEMYSPVSVIRTMKEVRPKSMVTVQMKTDVFLLPSSSIEICVQACSIFESQEHSHRTPSASGCILQVVICCRFHSVVHSHSSFMRIKIRISIFFLNINKKLIYPDIGV